MQRTTSAQVNALFARQEEATRVSYLAMIEADKQKCNAERAKCEADEAARLFYVDTKNDIQARFLLNGELLEKEIARLPEGEIQQAARNILTLSRELSKNSWEDLATLAEVLSATARTAKLMNEPQLYHAKTAGMLTEKLYYLSNNVNGASVTWQVISFSLGLLGLALAATTITLLLLSTFTAVLPAILANANYIMLLYGSMSVMGLSPPFMHIHPKKGTQTEGLAGKICLFANKVLDVKQADGLTPPNPKCC